jgi:hypothetical protein
MAKKFLYLVNYTTKLFMYKIEIEPVGKKDNEELSTIKMLGTMLDILETVNQMDDSTFVLRMKLSNNLEFLVDQLMSEYEQQHK